MITKVLWEKVHYNLFVEPIDYFLAVVGSILTIPIDILLSPLELIGYILYKLFRG